MTLEVTVPVGKKKLEKSKELRLFISGSNFKTAEIRQTLISVQKVRANPYSNQVRKLHINFVCLILTRHF